MNRDSILFIGKYDNKMHSLEERVVYMNKNSRDNLINFQPNSMPDVVKYPIKGFNCDVWVFLGDVKPTLLLKSLISETKIIIFTFNLSHPDTLTFLNEGWLPILKRVNHEKQQKIFVGTQSDSNLFEDQYYKIENTKDEFHWTHYFEEGPNHQFNQKILKENRFSEINLFDHLLESIEVDEFVEIKKNVNENEEHKFIQNKKFTYELFEKNGTASLVKYLDNSKNEILIPRYVSFKSKHYTITHICQQSFRESNIKELSFSANSQIQYIDNFAFFQSLLEKLYIPSSLKAVSNFCFVEATNLKTIEIDPQNRYFSIYDSFLVYNRNGNALNKNINKLNGERILALEDFNFENEKESVKFIKNENRLFITSNENNFELNDMKKCQNINYITFESSKSIFLEKFYIQFSRYLRGITIRSKEIKIGQVCIVDCTNLRSIVFEKSEKVTFWPKSFFGCENLNEIDINCSEKLELNNDCFLGNYYLKVFNATTNEIFIGSRCFMNCIALSSISIQNTKIIKIGPNAFSQCKALRSFKVNAHEIEFGEYCFSKAVYLQTVEISGANLLKISEGTFENCQSLTEVSISDSMNITFGPYSFKGCKKLTKISMHEKSKVFISEFCFDDTKNLSTIELDCSELTIENSFINKFSSLSSKTLSSIKSLNITIGSITNDLNIVNKSAILETAQIASEQSFKIESNTFDQMKTLEQIKLSTKSSIIIEAGFLCKHDTLKSIEINSSSVILGESCFNETRNLIKISIDSHYIKMGSNCFNNSNLKSIILKSEEVDIGEMCFNNCQNLTSFNLNDASYIKIGNESFQSCKKLNEFNIIPSSTVLINNLFEKVKEVSTKTIYQVKNNRTNVFYFSKSIKTGIKTKEKLELFFKCMLKYTHINDKSILPIIGFTLSNFEMESQPTFIMQCIQNISLEEALIQNKLTETQRYAILIGITKGMKYLHSKNITHKNLIPSNILIDDNFHPYIINYSIKTSNNSIYTAPEIIKNNQYSYKSDVYAYSIIAYELLSGKHQIGKFNVSNAIKNFSNKQIKEFFEKCLSLNPSNRPTFNHIFEEVINPIFANEFKANILETNNYIEFYEIQIKEPIEIKEPLKQSIQKNVEILNT